MYSNKLRIKTNSLYLVKWMKSPKNTFIDKFEEGGKKYNLNMRCYDTYDNPERDHILYPFFDFSAKEIIEEAKEFLWGIPTPGKTLGYISIQDIGADITLVEFESNHTVVDKIFEGMIKKISMLWDIELGETRILKTTKNKKYIYVPTRKKSLGRWKKIYSIYLSMKKEYAHDFDEEESKNPNVSKKDLASRVGSNLKWRPSERTLERIIKAGDVGLLK